MVLEAITIGVIGLTYATGDEERRARMRKIGSDIAGVAVDTVHDTVDFGKSVAEKLRAKKAEKAEV